MVRRLSRPQPLHRVRSLSAFRPRFVLLDQSRDSGAGDAVDPAADAKSVRHANAVSCRRRQPDIDRDHRAALARQHAADRYFRRAGDPGAFPARRAWRQDFVARKNAAVRIHLVRRGHAQRDARRAAWPVLRRLDGAAMAECANSRDRAGSRQPDRGCRRDDAAHSQLRAVGTIRLDARRLRCRVRTNAAGWHRRALSERSLSDDEAETVPVS